jgi:hypothetical protein
MGCIIEGVKQFEKPPHSDILKTEQADFKAFEERKNCAKKNAKPTYLPLKNSGFQKLS